MCFGVMSNVLDLIYVKKRKYWHLTETPAIAPIDYDLRNTS